MSLWRMPFLWRLPLTIGASREVAKLLYGCHPDVVWHRVSQMSAPTRTARFVYPLKGTRAANSAAGRPGASDTGGQYQKRSERDNLFHHHAMTLAVRVLRADIVEFVLHCVKQYHSKIPRVKIVRLLLACREFFWKKLDTFPVTTDLPRSRR